MSPSPKVLYVELRVPNTETEQEFLLLAVQAAVKKYRETRHNPVNQPQIIRDEAYALEVMVDRFMRSIQQQLR